MTAKDKEALGKFRETIHKIKSYEESLGVLYWDLRTGAPRKGMDTRSEAIGVLSGAMFQLSTSPELGELLAVLEDRETNETLSEIDRRLVAETRKDYDRSVKIPPKLYQEYVVLASQSESKWEEAKADNDYAGFRPYLEKVIHYTNQFIDLWGAIRYAAGSV